jgi:hypothetical protein
MEFHDRVLKCAECGAEFVFTSGEQMFFADKGFKNEPKRCKGCKAKRAEGGGGGGGNDLLELRKTHDSSLSADAGASCVLQGMLPAAASTGSGVSGEVPETKNESNAKSRRRLRFFSEPNPQ